MRFITRGVRGASAVLALATGVALAATGWAGTNAPNGGAPAGVSAEASGEPDPFIRDVHTWVTTSEADRSYKISVALPANYSETGKPYRVLYVTDANAEFGMAVETARLNAPGTLVVGIGYDNPGQGFAASGVPRTLDLTPTRIAAADSGGAPEFLSFLRDELVPYVEDEYHVTSDDRALMGHSFGGLFATYALLHNEGLFERFVIACPSIWWDDRAILDMEQAYSESHDDLDARVFLSVGSLEETTSGFPMTSDMTAFARTLSDRDYGGLELGAHVFEDETHLSVIGAAFSRGLRFIYAAPGETVPGTTLPEEAETTAPVVATHPADVRVEAGEDATFTAAATGSPAPSMRWQTRLPDAGDWVDVPDATATSLTISAAPESATGTRYRAVFTNSAGEATTDAATLTVVPGEEPGAGGPSEEDLTDANRGTVSVPDSVAQGGTAVVTVGTAQAEESVDVYLFSAPVLLGTRVVTADGTATVTIPADAALGAHRIAVYASDGALIGWAGTTVTAAPGGAAAAGPDRLSDTGGEAAVGVLAAALLLLTAGGGLIFATRRRDAAGHV
ncbi:alpha/beta hydrolase-fold protein [Microbacterium sp. W4I20]|uniref:alpha/beta hydrolase-fold protein n=1 Tax=Microbacterium sp. W4I20 TaxID=3042262 RepID=UPI00277EF34C|nr:alpha/beta hydrolase-fold protein [Microbacterium sp. W4I20]MDQ0728916.1 putative alpha/beta superfamily hydrolase [Microbacterium sp. W4I20]